MKFCRFAKKCFALMCVAVLTVFISSCGGKENINIGCFPNITHSQALYGMTDENFDKAFGDSVNVNWYTFNAGPSEMESIRAGSIDIGYIGPIPAITGYAASGSGITIIAGVAGGGSILVTAKDVNITEVSQLSGLKVAVPQFGNTQDIILRMLLAEAGLSACEDGGTVEIVQQANANIKALLAGGQIDAALVPEPWGTRLVNEAGANVLLDYDEILGGNYPVAVVVVRNDYLAGNRDEVKAFLREHIRITNAINGDLLSAAEKVNGKINFLTGVSLSEDVLADAYGRINFDVNVSEEAILNFVTLCKEQGIVKTDINYDNIVDLSLLGEVFSEQTYTE